MTEIRCAIELRAEAASPGRLTGVLMDYEERSGDRAETFRAGSLRWPMNGVVLNRQHQRAAPIMRVVPELRGSQVVIDTPLPDTAAGRDAAAEIRSGLFAGLSVEFRAVEEGFVGSLREIRSALLTGAGLVDSPSYRGSRVEVRQAAGRKRWWL